MAKQNDLTEQIMKCLFKSSQASVNSKRDGLCLFVFWERLSDDNHGVCYDGGVCVHNRCPDRGNPNPDQTFFV